MNVSRLITISMVMLISIVAVFIQKNSLFNMDVNMLMHVSERMFNGGKYGIDIFESNPPMILYIYTIPMLAAKLFSVSLMISFNIFTFLLIFVSSMLCLIFIEEISKKIPVYKSYILLPATVWMLLLPGVNFGQREHIMLILIMPYVFLSIASLYDISTDRVLTFIVAIIAGIGFCIKPHFFIPFFMCLLYRRKITMDSVIIMSIAILYFIEIVIFYPSYFTKILPLVFEYYYPYFDRRIAWSVMGIHFSFIILAIYGITFYFIKNKKLENVFAIYALGFIFVYLLQKSQWLYHLYPAIAFIMFLTIQMVYRYVVLVMSLSSLREASRWVSYILISWVSIFLLRDPIKYYYLINQQSLNVKSQDEFKIIEHLSRIKNINNVYFLSNNPSPYPAMDYLNFKDIQLIQCYWFLPGMYRIHHSRSQIDLNNFRNMIVEDMIMKNPDVIVVSDRLFPGSVKNFVLAFFLQNEKFKNLLANYKKVDSYDNIMIYKNQI